MAVLLGIPFWMAVLIVLAVQGAVGFFGYELIHRVQAVLSVVLFATFVVFAVKLVGGHQIVTPATVQGADLAGAFVLEVTIAFSLAVSWASYAADFSRYLPADSSRGRVFGIHVSPDWCCRTSSFRALGSPRRMRSASTPPKACDR